MKNLPQGFISTLLAQKKLSGNGNSNNSNNATVSDEYSFNPRLSDKPSFHTPNIRDDKDFGMPISYVVEALFGRVYISVIWTKLSHFHGITLTK